MEYNPALPIYLQAANSIKRDIVTGKLPPGAKLPSVRDLAVEYTINPNTVSRVYKELESEGRLLHQTRNGNLCHRRPRESRPDERRNGRHTDPGFSGRHGAAWFFQKRGDHSSGKAKIKILSDNLHFWSGKTAAKSES